MRGARLTLQRDIPKYEENLLNEKRWSVIYYGRQCENDPSMIRTWTGHLAPPPFAELTFHALETHFVCAPGIYPNFTKCCACHENSHSNITKCCACYEKWDSNVTDYSVCHQKRLSWLILLTYETAFTLGEAIASNVTKYCACHANDIPKVQNMKKTCWKRMKRHLQFTMADDARLIRAWSEHELWSSRSHRSPSLLFTLWRRSLYRKMRHFVLRLSTVISPNAAPARKSDTPTSLNVAPAARSATATSSNATTKSETPTSPNTAPATKNDSHDWSYYDNEMCNLRWQMWVMWLMSLDWTVTELWLERTETGQNSNFTELLDTWLSYYVTELLPIWTVASMFLCNF